MVLKQAFLNVNGLNLAYLEAGNNVLVDNGSSANAKVDSNIEKQKQHLLSNNILFIHGLGSSADRWLDIPDALSLMGRHAVALDLPGFGLSDKPIDVDYTIGKFVKVIVDFMYKAGMVVAEAEKVNVSNNNKISIIGHSLGGYIAAQLAIEYPDLIDKLVLIDTSGMLDGQPTPLLQEYLNAAMNPTKENVRSVFEQLVAAPVRISDALVYGFIHRINQPGAKHAFKSAYDNSVYTQIGADRLRQIGDNSIPTLLIWGRQDQLIPLRYFKIFQESIKDSQVVIVEDAGHAPFSEKPAIVTELLHKFISS